MCRVLTFNDFGQTSNMAGSAVSGMVNLAGSEKCYGNKSCMKLMHGQHLVWYVPGSESLEIIFQAPDDLSTITGRL